MYAAFQVVIKTHAMNAKGDGRGRVGFIEVLNKGSSTKLQKPVGWGIAVLQPMA